MKELENWIYFLKLVPYIELLQYCFDVWSKDNLQLPEWDSVCDQLSRQANWFQAFIHNQYCIEWGATCK